MNLLSRIVLVYLATTFLEKIIDAIGTSIGNSIGKKIDEIINKEQCKKVVDKKDE